MKTRILAGLTSLLAGLALLAVNYLYPSVLRADEALDAVEQAVIERLPDLPVTSLEQSPVPGLYELVTEGQIYYVDAKAEHLLDGSLIDLQTRSNLTEQRMGGLHMALINAVDEEDMIIYEPKGEAIGAITVFTDLSCGYCRRLHSEIDDLLDNGVRVRYLAFPRAGLGTQAAADLESVWCSKDPQGAMTIAKNGGDVPPATCENPIAEHVALAEKVGLRGTPLIYTDDGQMIPGYRPALQLVDMVKQAHAGE